MNVSTLRWIHKVLFVYKYGYGMHVCGRTFTPQPILIQNQGPKSFHYQIKNGKKEWPIESSLGQRSLKDKVIKNNKEYISSCF